MNFFIYLIDDEGKIYLKTMEPEDTFDYKFILSDKIENDLPEGFNQEKMEKINKLQAIICHGKLMELRLNIKQLNAPGAKLQKQDKYYVNVLSSYINFFEGMEFQLPQWRIDRENNIPRFAINLVTGDNVRLSKKQGIFVKLFYEHFVNSRIGNEWMWFSEAYNKLEERYQNTNWESMSDIFEKREGKEKLGQLFDVNSEGRKTYYRIKTANLY
tara:strand:- start:5360 stop:6001 length:642 start_codon:yes stop_codon:yes gene_type:complete